MFVFLALTSGTHTHTHEIRYTAAVHGRRCTLGVNVTIPTVSHCLHSLTLSHASHGPGAHAYRCNYEDDDDLTYSREARYDNLSYKRFARARVITLSRRIVRRYSVTRTCVQGNDAKRTF